jgi:hypothetical protein
MKFTYIQNGDRNIRKYLSESGLITAQWSESCRTRNHTLLPDVRLPHPGGPGSHIYIPQEQGSPVTPRALGSFYVASYDSQGYDGGIPTHLHTERELSSYILHAFMYMYM